MLTIYGPRITPPEGVRANVTSKASKNNPDVESIPELSPFLMGPVSISLGSVRRESKIMENGWQYSKAYEEHLDEVKRPTIEHAEWALNGFSNDRAVRFPMGRGAKPEYSIWRNGCFGYVAARLIIYIPMYVEAILRTPKAREALDKLREIWHHCKKKKQNLSLFDYDGYNHIAKGKTYLDVVLDEKKKMGHAFVLAMMLEEKLDSVVRNALEKESLKIKPYDLPTDMRPFEKKELLIDLSTNGSRVYLRQNCLNRLSEFVMASLSPGGKGQIPWKRQSLIMHGQEKKEQKMSTSFGDAGLNYRYSGKNHFPHEWKDDKSGALEACLYIVRLITGEHFNYCLMNYYENGKIGLSPHSDDIKSLEPNSSIASLSIGAERVFKFIPKLGGMPTPIVLQSGSLLTMNTKNQEMMKHEVPKSSTSEPRLNLTFRCVKKA